METNKCHNKNEKPAKIGKNLTKMLKMLKTWPWLRKG